MEISGFLKKKCFYLGQNVSGKADVASGQLSSRRDQLGERIHKYCFRSTLPVENNSDQEHIRARMQNLNEKKKMNKTDLG